MRKIKWQKWQSPLSKVNEYVDINGNDYNSEVVEDEPAVKPVMVTPVGLVPIQVYNSFNDNFRFYMGHTNFTLEEDIGPIIEDIEGVETLDFYTRYRFRIGIGHMFDPELVMRRVEEAVGAVEPKHPHGEDSIVLTSSTIDKITNLKSYLSGKRYWAIYLLPNDSFESIRSDDKVEVLKALELYEEAKHQIGGMIFAYDK